MATERIDIVVSQQGATEVKRSIDSIGQSASGAAPRVESLQSAINRLGSGYTATIAGGTQLKSALNGLGPAAGGALGGLSGLTSVSGQVGASFGTAWTATAQLNTALGQFPGVTGRVTAGFQGMANAATAVGGGAGGAVPPVNNLGQALNNAGGAANRASSSFFSIWRWLLALAIIEKVTGWLREQLDAWTLLTNQLRLVSQSTENLVALQEGVYNIAQKIRAPIEDVASLYKRMAISTKELGLSQQELATLTTAVGQALRVSGANAQETRAVLIQLSQAFNKGKLDGDEFRSVLENAPRLTKAFVDGLNQLGGTARVTQGSLLRMSREGKLTLDQLVKALLISAPEIAKEFESITPTIGESFTVLRNSVVRWLGQMDQATGLTKALSAAIIGLSNNLGLVGVVMAGIGTALLIAFGPAAISAVVAFGVTLWTAIGGPIGLILILLSLAAAAVYAWGDSWKVTADGVTVLDYIRAALQYVWEAVTVVAGAIGTAFSFAWGVVQSTWGAINSFFDGKLGTLGQAFYSFVTTYLGVWIGFYNAIVAAFQNFPAIMEAIFKQAMNAALFIVQTNVNAIIDVINSVLTRLNLNPLEHVDLSSFRAELSDNAQNVGTRLKDAFSKGLDEGKAVLDGALRGIGGVADKLADRARQISEERRKLEANQPQLSGERGPNTFKPDNSKELEKLQRQYNSLLRTIDPITGAQEKLRAGTETLNKAFEAGIITMERRDELLARLKEHLKDQLDPLGKINREMDKEKQLLFLSNREREIQKKLLEDIEKLRKAGVELSPIEKQRLEEQIRNMQTLKEQAKLLGDVMQSAFNRASDAFDEFLETGKINWGNFLKQLLKDIAKAAFQAFVLKPLLGALQNVLGGVLGGIFGSGGNALGLPTFGLATGGSFVVGSANSSTLPKFATGTNFTVRGGGGVDGQLVQFRASPGERVSVARPGQESDGGKGQTIVFNIQTPDVRGFKASETQIAARMARIAARGNRNL